MKFAKGTKAVILTSNLHEIIEGYSYDVQKVPDEVQENIPESSGYVLFISSDEPNEVVELHELFDEFFMPEEIGLALQRKNLFAIKKENGDLVSFAGPKHFTEWQEKLNSVEDEIKWATIFSTSGEVVARAGKDKKLRLTDTSYEINKYGDMIYSCAERAAVIAKEDNIVEIGKINFVEKEVDGIVFERQSQEFFDYICMQYEKAGRIFPLDVSWKESRKFFQIESASREIKEISENTVKDYIEKNYAGYYDSLALLDISRGSYMYANKKKNFITGAPSKEIALSFYRYIKGE